MTLLADPVTIGTDGQVNDVAGDAGGDVETLGYVAVLALDLRQGLLVRVLILVRAVALGLVGADGGGQRYALADLDQRRGAFDGLHLLDAAVATGGAVVDDAGLALAVDAVALAVLVVVFTGVDADQQAPGRGVELAEEVAQFLDLGRFRVDDQLVLVGAGLAVLAEKVLGDRQQVGAGAVVQGNDFGGGLGAEG